MERQYIQYISRSEEQYSGLTNLTFPVLKYGFSFQNVYAIVN